ncbi:MAG: hypothetical protein R2879_10830 [Saprospiraceae bacterium]
MKVNLLFVGLLMVATILSCQKDDDLFASEDPLVGRWQVTQEYHYYEDGVEQMVATTAPEFRLEFYKNNTGKKITNYTVEVDFIWQKIDSANQVVIDYPRTHSSLTTTFDQFDVVSANNEMQVWELARDPFDKYRLEDGLVIATNDTTNVKRWEEIKWELVKRN